MLASRSLSTTYKKGNLMYLNREEFSNKNSLEEFSNKISQYVSKICREYAKKPSTPNTIKNIYHDTEIYAKKLMSDLCPKQHRNLIKFKVEYTRTRNFIVKSKNMFTALLMMGIVVEPSEIKSENKYKTELGTLFLRPDGTSYIEIELDN